MNPGFTGERGRPSDSESARRSIICSRTSPTEYRYVHAGRWRLLLWDHIGTWLRVQEYAKEEPPMKRAALADRSSTISVLEGR